MITAEKLALFAPRANDVAVQAAALELARQSSTVSNVRRLAAFLGQISVETAGLTAMSENLNYRDPERLDALFSRVIGREDALMLIAEGPQAIANRVYAGRLGNGDEASGDGWRYRGSGYKQLTGRANYREMGALVGLDLEKHPDLVRVNPTAARVAFAFWDAKKCSPLAELLDIGAVTERINGPARLALAERRSATDRALRIWGG